MEEEEVQLLQLGLYTFRLLKRSNGTYRSEPLPLPHKEEGISFPLQQERVLARIESTSQPGDYHYVIQSPGGTIYCTCWGFKSPKKCWHYRGIMEILQEIPACKITEPIVLRR